MSDFELILDDTGGILAVYGVLEQAKKHTEIKLSDTLDCWKCKRAYPMDHEIGEGCPYCDAPFTPF